jgi:hypothetical protein
MAMTIVGGGGDKTRGGRERRGDGDLFTVLLFDSGVSSFSYSTSEFLTIMGTMGLSSGREVFIMRLEAAEAARGVVEDDGMSTTDGVGADAGGGGGGGVGGDKERAGLYWKSRLSLVALAAVAGMEVGVVALVVGGSVSRGVGGNAFSSGEKVALTWMEDAGLARSSSPRP